MKSVFTLFRRALSLNMFLLKLTLPLCFFLFLSPVEAKWDELVVKWDMFGIVARTFNSAYFSLPTTAAKAKSANWNQVESDSEYWDIWCYENDPRVCILTDQQGFLAGMDVGLPPSDFQGPYDFNLHPSYVNVTRFGTLIRKTRFFLVPQDVLKSGGRSDMSEGLGSGLWLQEGDKLTEVPITESEIQSKTSYVEESCIPEMGKHYYYNTTPSLDCNYFEPYFLLTNTKTKALHGVGFQGFGMPSKKSRKWFEDVPAIAIRPTVPTAPDCLVDWAAKYGVISLHIYFVSGPWGISC